MRMRKFDGPLSRGRLRQVAARTGYRDLIYIYWLTVQYDSVFIARYVYFARWVNNRDFHARTHARTHAYYYYKLYKSSITPENDNNSYFYRLNATDNNNYNSCNYYYHHYYCTTTTTATATITSTTTLLLLQQLHLLSLQQLQQQG